MSNFMNIDAMRMNSINRSDEKFVCVLLVVACEMVGALPSRIKLKKTTTSELYISNVS